MDRDRQTEIEVAHAGGFKHQCEKCNTWLDDLDTVAMVLADGNVGCNTCATDADY